MVTAVIFASSCRIESLAILRLKLTIPTLGERELCHFPIEDKYFHFLMYSGWFHAIVADIPHLLVAVALLDPSNSEDCGSGWLPDWLSAPAVTIFFSIGSILWGFVSRTSQWVVAQAQRRTHGNEPGPADLSSVNTATRDFVNRIQEENRQLRERIRADQSDSEQGDNGRES